MKLIGRIPDSETYLLGPDDFDFDQQPDPDTEAQVLDLSGDGGTLHPPQKFHSITAHMPYLELYQGDDGEMVDLLNQADIDTAVLAPQFSEGDPVQTPQGLGVVVEVRTESFEFKGDDVDASADSPTYIVELEDELVEVQTYSASELWSTEVASPGVQDSEK